MKAIVLKDFSLGTGTDLPYYRLRIRLDGMSRGKNSLPCCLYKHEISVYTVHVVYVFVLVLFLLFINISMHLWTLMRHGKTNKMIVRPAKTQISLGICPVWSESSLSAWWNLGSLATCWAHSEDSDQTGRMRRLIWIFAGRTLILLVLSCRGSYVLHGVYSICI